MTTDLITQRAPTSTRTRGLRSIGVVGSDIPIELIIAADAVPIRLAGIPDVPTPMADRYIEPSFSPQSRSIAERWLGGALDDLDAVVFSRSDDSAQRLYYYLCELQRMGRCKGPTALLFDMPKILRPISHTHAIESTQRLARALATPVDTLDAAATQLRSTREQLLRLHEQRGNDDVPVGSALFELEHLAGAVPAEQFDAFARAVPTMQPHQRLLLLGSPPPDARLHRAVERANATFVHELHEPLPFHSVNITSEVSIQSLATQYHEASVRHRERLRAPGALAEVVRDLRVNGAIIWMIEEDTGLAWELPNLQKSLGSAGIPTLVLPRQQWSAGQPVLDACTRFASDPEHAT